MLRMSAFLVVAIGCMLTACSAEDGSLESSEQALREDRNACVHDGKTYNVGDPVPSGDCNSCSCGEGGRVICTAMACEVPPVPPCPPPPSADVCKWMGKEYRVGESVPSGDSCNTCGCNPGGIVACTTKLCDPGPIPPTPPSDEVCKQDGKEYRVGESVPSHDSCNRCACNPGGIIACTAMACP